MDVAAVAVGLAQEVAGCARRRRRHPRRHRPGGRPGARAGPRGRGGAAAGTRPPKAGTTRLFVNAGRASGVRPQDIVGALANESGLTGRDIGAIQIHERHSLVEIPEHAADDVLRSLRGSDHAQGPQGEHPPRPRLRPVRRAPPRRPPRLTARLDQRRSRGTEGDREGPHRMVRALSASAVPASRHVCRRESARSSARARVLLAHGGPRSALAPATADCAPTRTPGGPR